ncbi:MAG: hypothetical protein ACK5IR_14265, partial [Tropicimonas sp.]
KSSRRTVTSRCRNWRPPCKTQPACARTRTRSESSFASSAMRIKKSLVAAQAEAVLQQDAFAGHLFVIPRMEVEPTPGSDACADYSGRLRRIGEDVTEELEYGEAGKHLIQ